VARFSVQGRVV
jgi:hypothetical protein